MSNVVKPRGRKPTAVYWRRRVVLLAVVVGLVTIGWRWAGDDEPADPAAESARSTQPASSPSAPGPSDATTTPAARKPRAKKKEPAQPKQRVITTNLRSPQGSCDTSDVVVVPDVADAETHGPIPLRLGLSTTGRQACTLQLTADKLALEVTSGDDLIWQSNTCPDVLDPQSVTLRPGWLSYVEAMWSGRRATDDCLASNEFAEPGYYWAEAAVIGGEPARGQFRLEEPPPPPPPSKKPSKQPKADGEPNSQEERQQDEGQQEEDQT